MLGLREKRFLKEWLNSEEFEAEWDETVRSAVEGIECEKCKTENGVLFFDFGRPTIFLCWDCMEKVKTEEVPPPGANNNGKGLSLRFRVLTRDNFTCIYCGRNPKEDGVKLEVDHILPRSKGGDDDLDNLVTACWECNQGKKDLIDDNIIHYIKRKQD